jgi:hypothetical protein
MEERSIIMKTFLHNNIFRASTLLVIGMVISNSLYAGGDKFSPRIVGMGRTFTAVSRGLDAVGVNPANLALNDRDATVTINLSPVGVSVGSDFLNLKIYNDFFTGIPNPIDPNNNKNRLVKNLTDQDKQDILGLFPEGLARTQVNAEAGLIGISLQIGNFGFAIAPSIQAPVNFDLPRGYLEFPLNLLPDKAFYSFDGTALNASVTAQINTSVAYLLPYEFSKVSNISVGVGVKYLIGLAYSSTDHYNANISTEGDVYTSKDGSTDFLTKKIKGSFDFLQFVAVDTADRKPVGSGLGFDIGVSGLLFDMVQFGVSVTDIGSMTWDKKTKAIIGKSDFEITNPTDTAQQNTIARAFKGKTIDTTGFKFSLPTALHIGAAIQLDDVFESLPFRWLVATDMHIGFNEVAGNTKLVQFAIGTELDPIAGWLPLRTGLLLGGRERFAWSAGFGLHFANTFDLDFATQSIAILTNPETFRTGSFTMGMRLRF